MARPGPFRLPIHLPDVPPPTTPLEQRLDAILAELQFQRLKQQGPGSAIASAQDPEQPGQAQVEIELREPKRGRQR